MDPAKNHLNPFTRRQFIGTCSTCAAGTVLFPAFAAGPYSRTGTGPKLPDEKAIIRIVYAFPDPEKPNWPNIHYDFDGHINKVHDQLLKGCPGVHFLTSKTMNGTADEAKKILALDEEVDGYVVYLAGCLWGDLTETLASNGKPTIIADNLYAGSGEFLTSFAAAKRAGYPVLGVSSSDPQDLVDAVNCIDCIKKLKSSKVLVVGGNADSKITDLYGTKMIIGHTPINH